MTTYYVGSGGNDANDGLSWANRKLTLNGVEDVPVQAGDTVYVGPGTYRELLTVDVSGSAGSPIAYIGDYTGANTDGVGGVVRITGSNNDQTATRASCITASSKHYRTFRGFALDLCSSYGLRCISGTNWLVEQMHVSACPQGIRFETTCTNNTVRNCIVFGATVAGLIFFSGSTVDDSANVIESCIVLGGRNTNAVDINRVGGVTVRNCLLAWASSGVGASNQTAGQTATVNNCVLMFGNVGFSAGAAGQITEDYNTLWGFSTARVNTTTGANSLMYPPLHDTRWFFEAVNGGALLTPFDLASYSQLVELNSGIGAPAADARGTTVQGSYREWGPLEYDATLDIEVGAGGGGGPVIGSRIIRGLGAV